VVLGAIVMVAVALLDSAAPVAAATTPQVPQNLSSTNRDCTAGNGQSVTGIPWPSLADDLNRGWELSQGTSVTIALLDTGVAVDGVPELAGQVTAGPQVNSLTAPADQDCVGHGTFDAVLIAGKQDKTTGFSGVASQAHVLSLAVTDAAGNLSPDTIAAGIYAALAAGARIIACGVASLTTDSQLDGAVAQAIAAGALVVAPATLDGQTQSGPVYPAADNGVLSVSDVGSSGSSTASGQVTGAPVDVVAPGDNVTSVGVGGSVFVAAGASYAAAFVAGTAALVDSYRGLSSPADLIRRLEATAVHPGTSMPDPTSGYGMVDPDAAMASVLPEDNALPLMRSPADTPLVVPPPAQHPARSVAMIVAVVALAILIIAAFGLLTARARSANRRLRVDDARHVDGSGRCGPKG
jgi:membrane-anchored mycosin MYCP